MKIELKEHTVPKKTLWGTVQRSLNQHIVLIDVEQPDGTSKMVQCGYVGATAFLPLCGFPVELVEPVTRECEKQLGRKLDSAAPPPSLRQIQQMVADANGVRQAAEDDE